MWEKFSALAWPCTILLVNRQYIQKKEKSRGRSEGYPIAVKPISILIKKSAVMKSSKWVVGEGGLSCRIRWVEEATKRLRCSLLHTHTHTKKKVK